MGKVRTVLSCRECGQQLAQWAGRCPGCGAWGTIEDRGVGASAVKLRTLEHEDTGDGRIPTGLPGFDRVLGGGPARAGGARVGHLLRCDRPERRTS